jgi:chromate reductase, NAD(P)H dehydrogenase (quinone)
MTTDKSCDVSILVFSASLSSKSINTRLGALAERVVVSKGGTVDHARMEDFDCPSYDADDETGGAIPAGAERFKARLLGADAFIIAAPEYNASMPGVLKNAIDWVSRFRPQPFTRKHGLLMSASPSMVGGNRGLWSLRVPLEHLGARIYPDMFSLAQAHNAFGDDGAIKDAKLQSFFESTVHCWMQLVEATKHYPAMKTQWVEFLGERPEGKTDRVEETEVKAA